MAIRCSPHPMFPGRETNETPARALKLRGTRMRPNRATPLVKFSTANKVFEDQALGIICYQDEHGEVICEGYDEGPRYSRQASPLDRRESTQGSKDLHIPNFLPLPPRQVKVTKGPAGVLCINGFAAEEHGVH